MNQIELVTALPNLQWKPHSQKEITMTGEELVDQSDFSWKIGNVAVAGFIYHSYTSPPWMWFVLAEGVRVADLIDFRRLSTVIPKGTLTAVDVSFPVSIKFAKVYGFEDTGEEISFRENTYKVMRKV